LYGVIRWVLALMTSLEVSMPLALSASISSNSTARSTTTPLPMTGMHPGVRMPLGSRWRAYFSPSMTTV
jgi:hypothetical protein